MENGTRMNRHDVLNGFEEIVAEILRKPDMTNGELVEEINGAVAVRVAMQDAQVDEAERAVAAYAAMHRANQECMGYVRRITGVALEVNAKQHAYAASMALQRDSLRNLLLQAEQNSRDSIDLMAVRQIVEMEHPEPQPMPPFVAGFAADTRFGYGFFLEAGTGRHQYLNFIGYTLLIQTPPLNGDLEPTFLDPYGNPKTSLALRLDGWELQGLY